MTHILLCLLSFVLYGTVRSDECHLTPVIHVLQHPGCIPKPIPSFACTGRCTSYVQVQMSSPTICHYNIKSVLSRYQGARSGRQREVVCVVRRWGRKRQQWLCSVLKLHMMNLKSERWDWLMANFIWLINIYIYLVGDKSSCQLHV